MSREVARFIQSIFGELKISEARYEDLLWRLMIITLNI
jgi:hypothetical protein